MRTHLPIRLHGAALHLGGRALVRVSEHLGHQQVLGVLVQLPEVARVLVLLRRRLKRKCV